VYAMVEDEHALLEALHRHERRACDELVQHYSPRVYSIALRLTGNPLDAEEVLQETFINACRSIDAFEGQSSLNTWLYRIATNNGLMRLRRHRVPTVSLDAPDEKGEGDFRPQNLRDWGEEPESAALTAELRATMNQAVAALPETLRLAFVLRDLEGLSTEEAAHALDITPQALKVRLHRARLLLRERLADYFTAGGKDTGGLP
jgi:RNA polymerase sigma-70 factor, ECF subfamily